MMGKTGLKTLPWGNLAFTGRGEGEGFIDGNILTVRVEEVRNPGMKVAFHATCR